MTARVPIFLAALLAAAAILATRPHLASAQTTQPAQTRPALAGVDPQVIALLDRIEKRSTEVKTLQAHLVFDRTQELLGDKQRRLGTLIYVAGPPARFAAHFNELRADGRSEKKNRWYIFDGSWLVEKMEDQTPKRFSKWQIVPPGARPEEANPLALGGGPFVLPVNMNRKVILDRFTVSLEKPDPAKDPANSYHLKLIPKTPQQDVTQVDLWYDKSTLLPVKVSTYEADSGNKSVIVLTDEKTNTPINPKDIDTSEPTGPGWEVTITPWKK